MAAGTMVVLPVIRVSNVEATLAGASECNPKRIFVAFFCNQSLGRE
jgi:hypothetical protein